MRQFIETIFKFGIPMLILGGFSYEYFFLLGLGIDRDKAPIGTADFLRNWFILVPMVINLGIGALISIIQSIFEENSTEKKIFNEEIEIKREKIIKYFNSSAKVLFCLGILLNTIYLILGNNLLFFYTIGLCLLIFALFFYFLVKTIKSNNDFDDIKFWFFVTIAGCFFVINSGDAYNKGIDNHLSSKNNYQYIMIKNEKKQVVKIYDQWTLILGLT